MTGIGIRLGLYGGKMTVSYGWMGTGVLCKFCILVSYNFYL